MADKEPRRRRRRKDLPRKDDSSHSDFHAPHSTAAHPPDSDQDTEEEVSMPVPSHEPSKIAQAIFLILFAVLAVIMSTVFIAFHGTQIDVDDNGLESLDPLHVISEPIIFTDDNLFTNGVETISEDFQAPTESVIDLDEIIDNTEEDSQSAHEEEFSIVPPDIEEDLSKIFEESEDIIPPISELLEEDIAPPTSEVVKEEEEEEEVPPREDMDIVQSEDLSTVDTIENIISTARDIQDVEDVGIMEPTFDDNEVPEPDLVTTSSVEVPEVVHNVEEITSSESSVVAEAITSVPDESTVEEREASPIPEEVITESVKPTESAVEVESTRTSNVIVDDNEEDDDDDDDYVDDAPEDKLSYEDYEKADITNEADFDIRQQLDEIEKIIEKNPQSALEMFTDLLHIHPASPRTLFGKAQALDRLAELNRSNKMLENAITTYQEVMATKGVPDMLYMQAGKLCAERMQFRGFVGKSLKLLLQMSEKFPRNIELRNKIAVGYLLIGQNAQAKKVFSDIVKEQKNNGFAKVHLGFILKTDDSNYEAAIPLLSEGIATREQGVLDGRFFFHLGDALARVGKNDEAMKVYEDGVKENLFLSVYQRSLYNVQGLTGKPWWEPHQHQYAPYFQLLEKNWLAIKAEALALAGKSRFMPESENLQDKGDWKQFELFVRGKKIIENCALVPITCDLIDQMPDAATCKRGQVKFSIMQSNTHVWAHTGPTNCRLRSHLGLVVPEGVRIRVANETRTWEEGKVILFDDSFEHEVWHEGKSSRMVLIVDFWHPELTPKQRASLSPI